MIQMSYAIRTKLQRKSQTSHGTRTTCQNPGDRVVGFDQEFQCKLRKRRSCSLSPAPCSCARGTQTHLQHQNLRVYHGEWQKREMPTTPVPVRLTLEDSTTASPDEAQSWDNPLACTHRAYRERSLFSNPVLFDSVAGLAALVGEALWFVMRYEWLTAEGTDARLHAGMISHRRCPSIYADLVKCLHTSSSLV
jgi:hypothetical protein